MKKWVLSGVCLLSICGFTGSAMAEPMYGIMMVVKGSVKIQNASQKTSDAKVGARVVEGDTVSTGADARAKIVMADRNVINVNPDTEVIIAKYVNDGASGKRNVELNLLKGKVRNNVEQTYDGEKNKFLIKTPTAVAGVRGTQFLASFDAVTRTTSIFTFKGAVVLTSLNPQGAMVGSPVVIKKGEMTQAAPNAVPEAPKALPKEEMRRLDSESMAGIVPDKRAVAADAKKEAGKENSKDSGKEPAAKDSAKPAAKEAGTGNANPAPPPPAMIDARDVDTGMAKEIKDVRNPAPTTPLTNQLPPPSATPNPLVKEIVREKAGKTRVNVKPISP